MQLFSKIRTKGVLISLVVFLGGFQAWDGGVWAYAKLRGSGIAAFQRSMVSGLQKAAKEDVAFFSVDGVSVICALKENVTQKDAAPIQSAP